MDESKKPLPTAREDGMVLRWVWRRMTTCRSAVAVQGLTLVHFSSQR